MACGERLPSRAEADQEDKLAPRAWVRVPALIQAARARGRGGDGHAGLGPQHLVDLTGVLSRDDVARKDEGEQARGNVQEHLFQWKTLQKD